MSKDIDFLRHIGNQRDPIAQASFTYSSRSVHSNNVQRIEAARKALVQQMETALAAVNRVHATGKQVELKQAFVEHMTLKIRIYKNDWVRGMALKAIAESSYEALRDYYSFLKEVDEKEDQTFAAFDTAFTQFAKVCNIQLIEDDSKFNKTMREIGKVNEYTRGLYLSVFRANYLNRLVVKDIGERNKEQADSSLVRMARGTAESFQEVLRLPEYPGGDNGARAAALAYLRYLNGVANKEYIAQIRIMKLDKMTQVDVDEFNKNINYFNTNQSKLIQAMNEANDAFAESKVPRRAPRR